MLIEVNAPGPPIHRALFDKKLVIACKAVENPATHAHYTLVS
jgi:hypothetical protein